MNTPADKPHVSATAVQACLQQALSPLELEVRDDSAAHAGHAGAREGSHLSVRIVSDRFSGLTRLARHRLVYDSLSTLMPRGIHALAIDARAPDEP
ncbi:MAG TPA: BolA family protein [Ideonella sp.]|jgi:BolA protein|uniref:BolA family protein n=1 Tax=Ideonella sp. TaxID=1929293 RepID=UPI002E358259|nr:BolA family protein [Ideonella sp.]HEX5688047.1 BolA family protein [Ideonella sp.]